MLAKPVAQRGVEKVRGRVVGADRIAARGIDVEWKAIEAAPDRLLISSLGMMCPFDLKEKQALIEAAGLSEMTDLMRSLMEMAAHGGEQSTAKH